MKKNLAGDGMSRRDFIKATAAVSVAALSIGGLSAALAQPQQAGAHAGGSDMLKVGLIGCGARGTGALADLLEATQGKGIEIIALGDAFEDQARRAFEQFKNDGKYAAAFKAAPGAVFFGFDNYKKVIDAGVDLVILATPPGFRPAHLDYAVDRGKHVFMEMPVAVDPVGIRSVLASARKARAKKLALMAGAQRRRQPSYLEMIKRIKAGMVGEIIGGEVTWMQGGMWVREKTAAMSEMEWQVRNWLYFDWLSGDHIVEQHIHNLDVMCWVMGGAPVKAIGMGGRQVRTDARFGNVYDHFAIEFEFASGARIHSKCCQWPGSNIHHVGERFAGTKGFALTDDAGARLFDARRAPLARFEAGPANPGVQGFVDLIAGIRKGEPFNEGEQAAVSTLCAILGRTAAYTGNEVKYSWLLNASRLDLTPGKLAFGPNPINSVPGPGVTKLV